MPSLAFLTAYCLPPSTVGFPSGPTQKSLSFNRQLREWEAQLVTIQAEERRQKDSALDMEKIRQALERELSFGEGIRSDLVTTILDRIVVKKESTKEEIHLDIFLKLGAKFEAVFPSASINRARNITPRLRIRRT